MSWKSTLVIIILAMTLYLTTGCGGVSSGEELEKWSAAAFIPVETVSVKKGTLEKQLKLSGEVQSEGKVDLLAGVPGTVSTIAVNTGEKVAEGQLLLELENKELLSQFRQAEAAYISSRDYGLPRRLIELGNGLRQAEINYRSAGENYERIKKLYQEEIVSQSEYEQVRDNYESALIRYEGAQEQLRLEKAGQAKELAALEAQLDQVRTALDKTRLKAPFTGTVTLVDTRLGVEVSPGTLLVSIVDFEQLYVALDVTETNLPHLQQGAAVKIKVPAAGFAGNGTVEQIALSPRPGSRSYPVKVFFQTDLPVRMGMHAELLVSLEKVEEALLVPREAVLREGEKHYVFVVDNGAAVERTLVFGLENEYYVEVLEGLSPGEQVVIRGQHYLEDGSKVEVIPATGGESS